MVRWAVDGIEEEYFGDLDHVVEEADRMVVVWEFRIFTRFWGRNNSVLVGGLNL